MTHSGSEKLVNGPLKWYYDLLAEFKRLQTGYSAIAIIGQSCLGSVAVMLLLMHTMPIAVKMTFVFLVTIFCMMFNAAVLANLKTKLTFNLLWLSVLFSITVIISNLF
jgi:esterase/lipase